jgi:hypothetical protein
VGLDVGWMVSVVAVGAATTPFSGGARKKSYSLLAVLWKESLSGSALHFLGQRLIVLSVLYNQRTAFLFDGSSVVKEVSDWASVFYYLPRESSTCAMDSGLTCLYGFVVDSAAAMQKETSSSDVSSSSSSSHVGRVRHRRRPNEVGYFTCHIVFISWNFVPYDSGLLSMLLANGRSLSFSACCNLSTVYFQEKVVDCFFLFLQILFINVMALLQTSPGYILIVTYTSIK